jgi:RNA polymerase sigma-70 factor (ECF subfamily)
MPASGSGREPKIGEQDVRARCQAGDAGGAVELALRLYGTEVQRLLMTIVQREEVARDAYGRFCEDLWQGLSGFRWESSLRTWVYSVARNAAFREQRGPARRLARMGDNTIDQLRGPEPRSMTQPWLRTEVKSGFARLRERLETDERMILLLRVDQQMSWEDVARILDPEEAGSGPEGLKRKSAAVRKQFQRIKERLREMAEQEGLIEDPS